MILELQLANCLTGMSAVCTVPSFIHSYSWAEGEKINVLGTADFTDGIFVNAKKAFSIKYLRYHEELLFTEHLSSTAISHAYHNVHSD